jgi:hypothetical protein
MGKKKVQKIFPEISRCGQNVYGEFSGQGAVAPVLEERIVKYNIHLLSAGHYHVIALTGLATGII